MASVVKKMECYNIRKSVKDLGEDLKEKIKAERVCDDYKVLVNAFVMLLSFERYYWRNGSYASLTVMLTDDGQMQTADIVGSGGGEGLWNFSYGANAEFADMAVEVLQEYGFQEKNNECNRN